VDKNEGNRRLGQLRALRVPVIIADATLPQTLEAASLASSVRSTAALAAPWFVGAALGLDALSTFYAADEPLLVARSRSVPTAA
jgi:hypothetical protein